ncbi:MAG: hypothetical protein K6U87_06980 [Firmicutes bacterium]|nr:hypothetical protein [Bacillota bacterium]
MSQPLETGLGEDRSLHFGIAHRVLAAAEHPLWTGAVLVVAYGGVERTDGRTHWGWHCSIRPPGGPPPAQFGLVLDLSWTAMAGWGASRRCGFLGGDPCACLFADATAWDAEPIPPPNTPAFADRLRTAIEQVAQLRRFWEHVGGELRAGRLGRWPVWEDLQAGRWRGW